MIRMKTGLKAGDGQTDELKLQMQMDRLTKAMTTASNVMKKTSDTASSIVQNMK